MSETWGLSLLVSDSSRTRFLARFELNALFKLRGDTVVETKAILKVVRMDDLVDSKTENATLRSLPWTQVQTLFQKGQYFVATSQQQLS